MPLAKIRELAPRGIILSGGPASVYDAGRADGSAAELFELGVPMLGICYGMQLTALLLGGKVVAGRAARVRPRDRASVTRRRRAVPRLRAGRGDPGLDEPRRPRRGAAGRLRAGRRERRTARRRRSRRRRASSGACSSTPRWRTRRAAARSWRTSSSASAAASRAGRWPASSTRRSPRSAPRSATHGRAICGLSGGVDSSVAAALVLKAIGVAPDLHLRRHRPAARGRGGAGRVAVPRRVQGRPARRRRERAFLSKLAGVTDPEQKRKIIGREFIAVFEEEAKKIGDAEFLVQGTLYPDVIESVSFKGPSATIKTHHNVGGLPERMHLKLIEPLRELFKDEVRALGAELGLPHHVLWRQPFPGPGLAVRVLGEVTRARCDVLRAADVIIEEEIRAAGLYEAIWQSFGVLLPVQSVGVMGDERTYADVLALRAVHSKRRHDRRLGAAAVRPARHHLVAHRQRGQGRQPRGLRHLVEAARDDRVGVARAASRARAAAAAALLRRRRARRSRRRAPEGDARRRRQSTGRRGRSAAARRAPPPTCACPASTCRVRARSGARRPPRSPSCAARWRACRWARAAS